jgi:hypothetical protein
MHSKWVVREHLSNVGTTNMFWNPSFYRTIEDSKTSRSLCNELLVRAENAPLEAESFAVPSRDKANTMETN